MEKIRSIKTLPLDGGVLPFHFINTVYAWRGENLHEYLNNYEEFLDWCLKVDLLDKATLNRLRSEAGLHPGKAAAAFQHILQVRHVFYDLFSGLAAAEQAVPSIAKFNMELSEALDHFEWTQQGKHLGFTLKEEKSDFLLPLYSIVYAAHKLLLEEDRSKIKECARCGWIFLDQTKNNGRRWCNPNSCGSTDKMHRYYQKKKEQKTG